MNDDERKRHTEQVFADTLRGRPLISNRSIWKRWRLVKNGRWHHKNTVLIGDAQRSGAATHARRPALSRQGDAMSVSE
ncbi:MAG: hypothetical protein JNM79_07340 [Burkholderiales bacterium]|nr:hypothetical protein [Burkholderiales bacterium]